MLKGQVGRCWKLLAKLATLSALTLTVGAQPPPSIGDLIIPKLEHAPTLEDFADMKPSSSLALRMARVDVFTQLDPNEGQPSQERTETYLGYDAKNLYIVWLCFDRDPGKIRALLARRDTIGNEYDMTDDLVQVNLDTFADRRRAYTFAANPLGVQADSVWTDSNGYDYSFDTVWDSKGVVTKQGYMVWMAIPFKSVRFYRRPEQTWGIGLQRVIPHDSERSFYPALSRKIQGHLTQEGRMTGLEGIEPGRNIQLTPYVVARSFRYVDDRDPNLPFFTANHLGGDAGLDAKIILHDSLVLDLTFNPDFHQVESDEPQITVNQRFEVFFPEKRPFFQENANFFATPINLYFTRRIVDPQFGARLTGKLGGWNLGLLAMDDQSPGRLVPDDDPNRRKRAYFSIARITHDIGKQSHIGVFYADREFSADPGTTCTLETCVVASNRVGGVDGHFQIGPAFNTEFQVIESTTQLADGSHKSGPSSQFWAEYSSRKIEYNVLYIDTAPGFDTLTGFFRRPDYRSETNFFQYREFPENKVVTWWGPILTQEAAWDYKGDLLEYRWEPSLSVQLKANTDFGFARGFSAEKLRPVDFGILTRDAYFNEGYFSGWFDSSYFRWLAVHATYRLGRAINIDPPANTAPFLADETSGSLTVSVRPLLNLTVDNTYLLERLRERGAGHAILNSHTFRSKWNYQVTKELAIRAILQYEPLIANPALSSLSNSKQFNVDLLISYVVHPGTAVYVGYNSDLQNLDRLAIAQHLGLIRTQHRFLNDSRQLFIKINYRLGH